MRRFGSAFLKRRRASRSRSCPSCWLTASKPIRWSSRRDRAGGRVLLAEVTELDHEATGENNRVPFRMVPRTKKVRVIYMEGGPPNAFRRLSEALAEDPDIECLDIGTVLRGPGRTGLARKNDSRRGYPETRAELFTYDVVICSDIARASFTQDQLNWTVEMVAERGGGFAMVGGNQSYGAGQYHKTVWNGLIPVDMGQWGLERGFENIIYWGAGRLFRVVVPPESQGHPIWHFADDPARNRAILQKMPVFYGCNLVDRLKPAATILGQSDRPLLSVGKRRSFVRELRPGPHLRHVDRHDTRLGPRIRELMGREWR